MPVDPRARELFDLPLVAVNTALLLLSSITYGFAMLEMRDARLGGTLAWLVVTGLFGAGFIGIELHEFAHLIHEGAGPQRSAFLSSFFTLVGTHGLHVTFGLVWLVTLLVQAVATRSHPPENRRRLLCLFHVLGTSSMSCGLGVFYLRVPDGGAARERTCSPMPTEVRPTAVGKDT